MTARQIRRAQEHKARKLARKAAAPNQSMNPPPEASAPLDSQTGQNTADHPAISQAKLQANRSNAQLSTGPRTAEGKAISSRNHLTHGFHGAFCVLPSENGDLFTELCDNLLAEHAPATATERLLVVDMARHYWLTQRALRLQESCFQLDLDDRELEKKLALYIRYQTTNQRAFHRCLADLLKLQKLRPADQVGFESQERLQTSPAFATAQSDRAESAPRPPLIKVNGVGSALPVGFDPQNSSSQPTEHHRNAENHSHSHPSREASAT